jgi:hypothetical protein
MWRRSKTGDWRSQAQFEASAEWVEIPSAPSWARISEWDCGGATRCKCQSGCSSELICEAESATSQLSEELG